MNVTREFETVAGGGKISMRERVIVPLSVSLHSARLGFEGLKQPELKNFDISVNGKKVFTGSCVEGEPHPFDPPLRLPAGWPTFEVSVYPYPEGQRLTGKVEMTVSFG